MFERIIWCEDCQNFGGADPCGEGVCMVDGHDTWYGFNAEDCEDFLLKLPL